MTTDELLYFIKYIVKEWVDEIKNALKTITNLARPKLWLFIFSLVLVYQIGFIRKSFDTIFTLVMILFIWMWDSWEAGHWRGEMRKERYKELQEKNKKEKKI